MNQKLKRPISEINEIIEEISKDSDSLGGYIVFDRTGGSKESSGVLKIIIKPPQKIKKIKSKINNESQIFDITDSAFLKRDFIESKALANISNYCILNHQAYLVQTPAVIGRLKKISENLQKGYFVSQFLKYDINNPKKPRIEISFEKKGIFMACIYHI